MSAGGNAVKSVASDQAFSGGGGADGTSGTVPRTLGTFLGNLMFAERATVNKTVAATTPAARKRFRRRGRGSVEVS